MTIIHNCLCMQICIHTNMYQTHMNFSYMSMYFYMYMHICLVIFFVIYMCKCIYICASMYACIHFYIYINVYQHTSLHTFPPAKETHTSLIIVLHNTPTKQSPCSSPSPAPCPQPHTRTSPRLGALPYRPTWGSWGHSASAGRQTTTTRCRRSLDKALCSCCHTLITPAPEPQQAHTHRQGLRVLCMK
jgi:hypothetical protein